MENMLKMLMGCRDEHLYPDITVAGIGAAGLWPMELLTMDFVCYTMIGD
jgi:hypothetical protein